MSTYDIDGVFVAHDGDLEISAEFRICDGVVSITKADGSPVAKVAKIEAIHPAARQYIDNVAQELHRIGWSRKESGS